MRLANLILIAIPLLLITACDKKEEKQIQAPAETKQVVPPAKSTTELPPANPLKNVYWGDTHLHTSYSPDAFLMGNQTADPDTAYNYAKGLPVVHP